MVRELTSLQSVSSEKEVCDKFAFGSAAGLGIGVTFGGVGIGIA